MIVWCEALSLDDRCVWRSVVPSVCHPGCGTRLARAFLLRRARSARFMSEDELGAVAWTPGAPSPPRYLLCRADVCNDFSFSSVSNLRAFN